MSAQNLADEHHRSSVEIKVNRKRVSVPSREVTGFQIKEAAIAEGLQIELSFQLSEELEHHQTRIIGNDQVVRVHEGSKFLAVHGDDNS